MRASLMVLPLLPFLGDAPAESGACGSVCVPSPPARFAVAHTRESLDLPQAESQCAAHGECLLSARMRSAAQPPLRAERFMLVPRHRVGSATLEVAIVAETVGKGDDGRETGERGRPRNEERTERKGEREGGTRERNAKC